MSADLLNDVARNAVDEYLRSDAAVKKIAETVQKTTDRAIEETLSSYSDFGKQVKTAVSKSLAIYGALELPEYNQTLLNLIALQVEKATKDSIQRQVAERMKDLLEPAPEQIKLSELVEEYRKYLKDRADSGCVCDSDREFHFSLKETDYCGYRVQLSEETPEKYSKADVEFSVSCHSRHGEEPKLYRMYTLAFDGAKNVEREMFSGPFYGFQRRIFQMHAAKTAIVIDVTEHDVDTSYGSDE